MENFNFPPATAAGTVSNGGNSTPVCQNLFNHYPQDVRKVVPDEAWTARDVYEFVTSGKAAEATRMLREMKANPATTPQQLAEFKKRNFQYVTPSGLFAPTRRRENLVSHSQILCIDFDHLGLDGEPQMWRDRLEEDRLFVTSNCFVSPSGDGLKWWVSIDTSRATHEEWFDAVSMYLKQRHGLMADRACRDVTRPCFLPNDPDCYYNTAFDSQFPISEFEPKPYLLRMQGDRPRRAVFMEREPMRFGRRQLTDLEMAQLVARAVVAQGVDITADYPSWRDIGFALAHSLGEEARQTFHDVSALYARYSQAECDALYDICLSHPGPIRIGTFFMLARLKAGIYLKEELQRLNRR